MSTNRSRRIDQDTAEHLLGGAVGGPSAGRDASLTGADARTGPVRPLLPENGPEGQVARVLAAAAAPATAGELAGEEAALAAFREARLAPAPAEPAVPAVPAPVRRRSMATAALARAFSTKAVAVVLGATALGGVAVAAGTGNLPSPLGGGAEEPRRPLLAPATVSSAPAAASAAPEGTPDGTPSARRPGSGPATAGPSTGVSSGGPSSAAPSTPAAVPPSPGARPSPFAPAETRGLQARALLIALCQGYTDRKGKGERPRLLVADPQFGALVTAAGGPEKVEAYCGDVLRHKDEPQGATPPSRPGGTDAGGTDGGGTDGGGTDGGKKDDGRKDDGRTGTGRTGAPSLPTALPTLPGVVPKPDRSGQPADASPRR
ncbi:hypothetical protein [Kitasatospora sp. NPDC059327]|uniref:hypothetical protein n=1 Tax=Kitasatospora sp. NPDC059327 TaxID=3346803 RepID=UPI0036887645